MKKENWIVGNESIRPNGPIDKCFYCSEYLGKEHKIGCVLRQRTIVLKLEMELVVSVPEDWGIDMIEYYYGEESSNCQSNFITYIQDLSNRIDCLCGMINVMYLCEAESKHEEEQKYFITETKF